jgi:hypothetical protein
LPNQREGQFPAPAAETRPEDKRGGTGTAIPERLGRWTVALLARPRVRTVLVGIALIIVGAFFIQHSVWTFPIVILGILMVIVAWVGSRLEGRFAVEWGEAGAGFEMRARFKSASTTRLGAPPLPAPRQTVGSTTISPTGPVSETEIPEADTVENETIEGEAHTIEIDAEEFRALVRAAEQLAARESASTGGMPVSWQEDRAA